MQFRILFFITVASDCSSGKSNFLV